MHHFLLLFFPFSYGLLDDVGERGARVAASFEASQGDAPERDVEEMRAGDVEGRTGQC
jgi:hypothetical protein